MLPILLAGALTLTGTQVTSGYGWELGGGINHLDSTGWSVQFYDTYSRDNLRYFAQKTAAELEKHTGVDFYVGTTINKTDAPCPGYTSTGRHRLVLKLDPSEDRSHSYMCSNGGGYATSSLVEISQYNWKHKTRAGSHGTYRKNVISHEMGHSVGLGHPDQEYLSGTDPLMSGNHWGGYWQYDYAHKYASYDIKGLKALVTNRP